jgi:serine/threonine protein phosphatase PrpC
MKSRIGFSTDRGPNDHNEDNGIAIQASMMGQDVVLLAVCDGMGGDANGARAAKEVTRVLSGFMAYLPPTLFQETNSDRVEEEMKGAILKWHETALSQLEEVQTRENLRGLTTTLVASFMWSNNLVVWWLGDSRAYRFRNGRLERLTEDHSKVEQTLCLPEEEALEHPERSKVSRFLRPGVPSQPDIRFYDWQEGDVTFTVSDGVSSSCRSWELESFIAYWLAADVSPATLCKQILKFVGRNVRDNATIAMAMRGMAKPFVNNMATLELPVFLRYGLKQHLVDRLVKYPATAEEWLARESPAWRQTSASESQEYDIQDHRIVGTEPPLRNPEDPYSICLICGSLVDSNTCPKHGMECTWRGLFVEVIAPSGEISYHPVQKDAYIFGRPDGPNTDIVLDGDEMVSPDHVIFNINQPSDIQLHDLKSDNGVWLRVRDVRLTYVDWLQEGLSVRVGRHHLTFRTTDGLISEPKHEKQIEVLKSSDQSAVAVRILESPVISSRLDAELESSQVVDEVLVTREGSGTSRYSRLLRPLRKLKTIVFH